MRLDRIIARSRIVDLRSLDLEGALRELLDTCVAKFPDLKPEALLKGLLARESTMTTYLGFGVALPHVRVKMARRYILAIGRSRIGIRHDGAKDDDRVKLIVMLIAGEKARDYLQVLASIARQVKEQELVDNLVNAADLDTLHERLIGGFGGIRPVQAQQNRINRLMFREAERVAQGAGCGAIMIFGDTFIGGLEAGALHSKLKLVLVTRNPIETSEDVVLASVGRDLCEKFFRGYSRKHWGLDLSELAAGVAARIPVRTNDDDRYFSDSHQCMPADGYTAMFRRMLDHPLITFETGVEFESVRDAIPYRHLIYTGPIDAYFGHCFGRLPYRSIEFRHEHLPGRAVFQPIATINHPNDSEYTRVTEFKYLTGQVHTGTSIVREYPRADGDPFYPIPRKENEALFRRYKARSDSCTDVTFVGRLAQYRYYDMDQVIGAALTAARGVIARCT